MNLKDDSETSKTSTEKGDSKNGSSENLSSVKKSQLLLQRLKKLADINATAATTPQTEGRDDSFDNSKGVEEPSERRLDEFRVDESIAPSHEDLLQLDEKGADQLDEVVAESSKQIDLPTDSSVETATSDSSLNKGKQGSAEQIIETVSAPAYDEMKINSAATYDAIGKLSIEKTYSKTILPKEETDSVSRNKPPTIVENEVIDIDSLAKASSLSKASSSSKAPSSESSVSEKSEKDTKIESTTYQIDSKETELSVSSSMPSNTDKIESKIEVEKDEKCAPRTKPVNKLLSRLKKIVASDQKIMEEQETNNEKKSEEFRNSQSARPSKELSDSKVESTMKQEHIVDHKDELNEHIDEKNEDGAKSESIRRNSFASDKQYSHSKEMNMNAHFKTKMSNGIKQVQHNEFVDQSHINDSKAEQTSLDELMASASEKDSLINKKAKISSQSSNGIYQKQVIDFKSKDKKAKDSMRTRKTEYSKGNGRMSQERPKYLSKKDNKDDDTKPSKTSKKLLKRLKKLVASGRKSVDNGRRKERSEEVINDLSESSRSANSMSTALNNSGALPVMDESRGDKNNKSEKAEMIKSNFETVDVEHGTTEGDTESEKGTDEQSDIPRNYLRQEIGAEMKRSSDFSVASSKSHHTEKSMTIEGVKLDDSLEEGTSESVRKESEQKETTSEALDVNAMIEALPQQTDSISISIHSEENKLPQLESKQGELDSSSIGGDKDISRVTPTHDQENVDDEDINHSETITDAKLMSNDKQNKGREKKQKKKIDKKKSKKEKKRDKKKDKQNDKEIVEEKIAKQDEVEETETQPADIATSSSAALKESESPKKEVSQVTGIGHKSKKRSDRKKHKKSKKDAMADVIWWSSKKQCVEVIAVENGKDAPWGLLDDEKSNSTGSHTGTTSCSRTISTYSSTSSNSSGPDYGFLADVRYMLEDLNLFCGSGKDKAKQEEHFAYIAQDLDEMADEFVAEGPRVVVSWMK